MVYRSSAPAWAPVSRMKTSPVIWWNSATNERNGTRDRLRLPASDSLTPVFPGPPCADRAGHWADWPFDFRRLFAYGRCRRFLWTDPWYGLWKKPPPDGPAAVLLMPVGRDFIIAV